MIPLAIKNFVIRLNNFALSEYIMPIMVVIILEIIIIFTQKKRNFRK